MTLVKPAPWAWNPALTRLPTIAAKLGAAYPMLEGSGPTTREVVEGQDLPLAILYFAGSTSPNPEYTAQANNGDSPPSIQLVTHGAVDATKGVALVAYFSPVLTVAEATWITDPANRFALLCESGADFSVKPAPWAWDLDALDPDVTLQAIRAKLKFLIPCWAAGAPIDLISGVSGVANGLGMTFGTVDGITCLTADQLNDGWHWNDAAVWEATLPYTSLIVNVNFGTTSFVLIQEPRISSLTAASNAYEFDVTFADPEDLAGPNVSARIALYQAISEGVHSLAATVLARGIPGAWALDGVSPNVPWTTVDGLAALDFRPDTLELEPGTGSSQSEFAIVAVLSPTLSPADIGGDHYLFWYNEQRDSYTDYLDIYWAALDEPLGVCIEVEVSVTDGVDTEYFQINAKLPLDFFNGQPHLLIINRTSKTEAEIWVDSILLDGVIFPPTIAAFVAEPKDELYLGFTSPGQFYELLLSPTALTPGEIAALNADPFGAIAELVAAPGSGGHVRRRTASRLAALLGR